MRVAVGVPGVDAEAAGETLEAVGALAVTWLDGGDAAILEPKPGTVPDLRAWRDVRAVGLFPVDTDVSAVRACFVGRPIDVDFVADSDWAARWRRHVEPRRFGALTVAPSHAPAAGLGGTVLRLDPGGAFGTGGHPTTRLCLAWLASAGVAGRSVLDHGCGSGILAIAAKLLGAARVVAVDHDPQALAVTRDNAAVNGVGLEVASNDGFDPGPPFDLVVANILADTLIAKAPRLRSCLAADGRIALCGLLPEQADGVARAYPDVVFEAPRGMEGWVLLAGRRVA